MFTGLNKLDTDTGLSFGDASVIKHKQYACIFEHSTCCVKNGLKILDSPSLFILQARTHARAHERTDTYRHARAHTHTRTHARTHARTHTHTFLVGY